ncbi:TonB-dependent receptor [Alteromonadaceae bacterium Bs31]|nr:TonB-dependent receptor [Alteromonadaceae bacterium Bs31]
MSSQQWRKTKYRSSNHVAGPWLAAEEKKTKPSNLMKLGLAISILSSAAHGNRLDDVVVFDIPQQRADISITDFAMQANITLVFPFEMAMGVTANELAGEYTIENALQRLLQDTNLVVNVSNEGQLTVVNNPSLGEKQPMHKKSELSAAVAGVVSSVIGVQTIAQDDRMTEEVFVTGIRASLERSMDVKRESSGVVDAISAEDIGKFPDSNLAESLQRITGVSIDRRNGEGSQVTVRGFGPQFNMITLNGRLMPTTSLNQNIAGGARTDSRAFDMDNLASEGVSGVEVYKTSKANITSGGIGATIDLKTARPMDTEGLKVSVGAKALSDTTNERGDDLTAEYSGLISWSNEKFGAMANFVSQERHSSVTGAYVNQWSANAAYTGSYPRATPDANIKNEPGIGQVVGDPSSYRLYHADHERSRTNGQVVLQFAPNDRMQATFDYTMARQELVQNRNELSLWFQDGNFPRTDLVFDDNPDSPTPVLYWETGPGPRDLSFAMQEQDQLNELESLGLNFEWQVNDALALTFDAHDSSSESKPNNDRNINWGNVSIGSNVALAQGADYKRDIPVGMLVIDDSNLANPNGQVDANEVGSQVYDVRRESASTDTTQIRINGSFEFSDTAKIDFGIESRRLEHSGRRAQKQQQLAGGWGIANPGDVDPNLIEPIDYSNLLDESLRPSDSAFFDNASGNAAVPLTQGWYGNTRALGLQLTALGDNNGNPITYAMGPETPDATSRDIEEDVNAVFFQFDTEFDFGSMPMSIVAGLRYEGTEVKSTANIAVPTFNWQSRANFLITPANALDQESFAEDASYDHLLPNLDIALDVRDDLVLRASFSETIARASFSQMDPGIIVNSGGPSAASILPNSVPGTANTGLAGILPLESDNIDFSLEWYFDDASYASIGYFDKRVSNFIGSVPIAQTVYGITDPSNGARAQAAQQQLIADGRDVNSTTLFLQMAATENGVDYPTDPDEVTAIENDNSFAGAADGSDPLATFSVSTATNQSDAQIHGFELAAQHFFGETGLGVAGNYTIVNGDVSFDNAADPASGAQFALVGLSDTANLSLMYENYGFSGRISWNWRDKFLNNTAVNQNEPEYTEAYQQLDLNLTYEILTGLFVSFEGINLTEENQRKFGRSSRQLTQYSQLGARYALGVRYTF